MGCRSRMRSRWLEIGRRGSCASEARTTWPVASSATGRSRMALQSAVLGVGAYLVIQHEATGWHHYRGLDPGGPRAVANRSCDRQLEGVCRCPAGLAAAAAIRRRCRQPPRGSRAHPGASFNVERRASLRPARRSSSCTTSLSRESWQRGRRHRAERIRQVVAGARDRRRMAAGARLRPARRRHDRPVGRPRSSAGISAICRRTSSCSRARSPRTSPASSPMPPAEDMIAAAKAAGVHELIVICLTATRRGSASRAAAVRRTAPAHRAGPRALRRSVPGRARRAQLQSRRGGRGGAHPGHTGVRERAGIMVVVAHRSSALPASIRCLSWPMAACRHSARRTRFCDGVVGARAPRRAAQDRSPELAGE